MQQIVNENPSRRIEKNSHLIKSSSQHSSNRSQIKPYSVPATSNKAPKPDSANPPELVFPFCDEVNDKYEKLLKIGEGTFGEVFKARNKKTNKLVALKRIRMENEKEGFPITAIREINILQALNHENIIRLIEICRTKTSSYQRYRAMFYLVFDFCEHDLAGLLSNAMLTFTLTHIKSIMSQLLNGLYYMHANNILHRDMKTANVFLTKEGKVKLGDFGLARLYSIPGSKPNRYTPCVVTLWYRPPELLMGDRNYGPPCDVWGAGCIMAELWTRTPILKGTSEQEQLKLIVRLCGSLVPSVWPGVERLPLYDKFALEKTLACRVKEKMKMFVRDPNALDLIERLLCLDPSKRIDTDTALSHDFFYSDPMPSDEDLRRLLVQQHKSQFEFLAPRHPGMNVKPANIYHAASKLRDDSPHFNANGSHYERIF